MSNAVEKLGEALVGLEVDHLPEQLCESCRSFPFDKSVFMLRREARNKDNACVTQKLSATLANSVHCFICNKAAILFNEFSKSSRGKGLDIDPQKTEFRMDFYNCIFSFDKQVEPPRPNGRMNRLKLRLWFDNPKERSKQLLLSSFQKCSPHPCHVDSFCATSSLTDWDSERIRPYEGRLRPLTANTDLFLKLKETCHIMHETRCINTNASKKLTGLRFVDVKRRCIVDGQLGDKYVALSYLWGQSPSREDRLCVSTASRFYQPSSLNKSFLPATIEDAITLTIALREAYLWVDRLCIKQDDVDDKAKFVPRMHEIYGSAELTIVATAGVDADAGLPGIRPDTRKIQQKVVMLEGTAMMETLDPQSACRNLIDFTSYNTRAWCFQERMLCYRALIFTAEQVYWECQRATWCEEACWEPPNNPPLYRHCLLDGYNFLRQPWGSDLASGVDFETLYRTLAEKYSERQISNPSDSLNAFQGILESLGNGFNQQFYWALPVALFERALAWPAESNIRRNLAEHFQTGEDGIVTRSPFPSWSWVGWIGAISIHSLDQWDRTRRPFVFYRLDKHSELVSVSPEGLEMPRKAFEVDRSGRIVREERREETTDTGDTVPPWFDTSKTLFTKDLLPRHVIASPLASSVLCFWTSCALLLVKPGNKSDSLQQGSKSVRVQWRQYPTPEPDLYDFAVICYDYGEYSELYAICLHWDNGVAYRIGQVKIYQRDWKDLETVWKPIVLG